MKVTRFDVAPNLPEKLAHLKDLAMNPWFSWNWEAVRLFIRLDAKLWEACYQNPVLMLGRISQSILDEAAQDESFVAELDKVYGHLSSYQKRRGWFERAHGDKKDFLAAYFCMEYGIDEGIPIYSGGLGILSGDHLKSTSDLGLPLVAVGLLYQKGYFQQRLNLDGWQQEHYPDNDWYNMPVTRVLDANGEHMRVMVDLAGEPINAAIWCVQVGRTPLYLLDTNLPENPPRHREITSQLYGGDRDMRIRQEIVLGIGGIHALHALGLSPTVYHINEGHSAFMALERMRRYMKEQGLSFDEAREVVWASTVFTTHTPVPAGNEVFDPELVKCYLSGMAAQMGVSWETLAELGKDSASPTPAFSMSALALRVSAFANGVSALHGEVARKMWKHLWPELLEAEVPVTSVTNGIHTRSWISHDLGDLLDRYLGPKFYDNPEDQRVWEGVNDIPDVELWRAHEVRRERLVFFARKTLRANLLRQGAGANAVELAEEILDPRVLTLGFARRFATYKRSTLLLSDPERLTKILTNPERPVQIVFAGKAHPQDTAGKEMIRTIIHFARQKDVRMNVAFLEDYDINIARYFVQGVDVWVNNPVRPMEASGTSGMKAAANGVPNLSVMDGWWAEGYSPKVGWMLGESELQDPAERDKVDSNDLYNLLELEVAPLFYDRDRTGVPRRWVRMMKDCLMSLAALFNTHRMVREYTERAYLPAYAAMTKLAAADAAKARELAAWRRKVAANWGGVYVQSDLDGKVSHIKVGEQLSVIARVGLGSLAPDDVRVEVVYGTTDTQGRIVKPMAVPMQLAGRENGHVIFRAQPAFTQSGEYGFGVRVLPQHESLLHAFTPPYVTWEK